MGMARQQETLHALVLASADSRDDRIVQLLTDASQRIPAVIRRARRQGSKVSGHMEPLTLSEVQVTVWPDRSLARVDGAWARASFPVIRGDLLRYALASTMTEVTLHLIAEYGGEPGAYGLLLKAWQTLDDADRPPSEDLLLLYEVRMLALSGVLPPPEALPGLDLSTQDTLAGWMANRWRPLAASERRRAGQVLEALIQQTSGRPLKSRAFLNQTLADG